MYNNEFTVILYLRKRKKNHHFCDFRRESTAIAFEKGQKKKKKGTKHIFAFHVYVIPFGDVVKYFAIQNLSI